MHFEGPPNLRASQTKTNLYQQTSHRCCCLWSPIPKLKDSLLRLKSVISLNLTHDYEIFRWDAKQDCIRRGGRLFEPRWRLIFLLCSNWKVKETKLTGLRSWMSWCTAMSPGLESAIGSESQILRQKTSMSWPIQLQCTEGIYCSGMFMHQTIRSWLTPTSGQVTQSGRGHCFREHCTQRRQAVPIKLNISAANGANGTICMKPSG